MARPPRRHVPTRNHSGIVQVFEYDHAAWFGDVGGRRHAEVVKWIQIFAAVFAVTGTWLQAYANLTQQRAMDPEGTGDFVAIDELRKEYQPVRHPIKYWRRQQEVDQFLAAYPIEAQRYRLVRFGLWAWAFLLAAALLAFVPALFVWS